MFVAFARAEVPPRLDAAAGLVLCGATGYGLSLRLYLLAQRRIGAGRTASIFAVAPFFGAAVAFVATGDSPGPAVAMAVPLLALGTYLHLTEHHAHFHTHAGAFHEHAHRHDDEHHDHVHNPPVTGEHTHAHRHEPLTHEHSHGPDLRITGTRTEPVESRSETLGSVYERLTPTRAGTRAPYCDMVQPAYHWRPTVNRFRAIFSLPAATAATVALLVAAAAPTVGCGSDKSPSLRKTDPDSGSTAADAALVKQGCDLGRPAVEYQTSASGPSHTTAGGARAVPCVQVTGFGSAEPSLGVTKDGSVFVAPVFTADGPRVITTTDQGVTWTPINPMIRNDCSRTFTSIRPRIGFSSRLRRSALLARAASI